MRFFIDVSMLPRQEAVELREKMRDFAFIANLVYDTSQNIVSIDVNWIDDDSLEYIRSVMNIPDCCSMNRVT